MKSDCNLSLKNEIKQILSTEEQLVCFFSTLPNIFTVELLIWCLRDELQPDIIKSAIQRLVNLNFVCRQRSKENITFFTMHERFRQIMSDTKDKHYAMFCQKLIAYYDNYISAEKAFSNQFYNDKLFYQIILQNNVEWRNCYQHLFEKGDNFECEKLLSIYQKAIPSSNRIIYGWFQYYQLQDKIMNFQNSDPAQYKLKSSPELDRELFVYWSNILGVLYINYGKYLEAEKSFSDALTYANNIYERRVIQYNICVAYFYKQQYMKALNLLCECDNLAVSDDLFFYIKYKFLLAIINMRIYKLDRALLQFEDVLQLKKKYQISLRNSKPLYYCHKHPSPICASMDKNIYNYIGEIYLTQGKFEHAIQYHLKGLRYVETFGNLYGMAWANNDLGKVYYLSGDIQTAQQFLEKSIYLFDNTSDKLAKSFPMMELSYVYQYSGDIACTINILKESFRKLKKKGLKTHMLAALNNLGRIYQSQGFLTLSKRVFEFCLSKSKQMEASKQYLGWINNNLGRNYLYSNDYDKAIMYFQSALCAFSEIHEKRGYIYVINNIGETYAKRRNYELALAFLLTSCSQKEKMGDSHGICYSYRELAEVYLKMGESDQAMIYINKAVNLCEKGNFVMLKGDILVSLGNYYLNNQLIEDAGDSYLEALNNYEKQNFYSRILCCIQKINSLIQKYNFRNMSMLDESYISKKMESDEQNLMQEIESLLSDI